MITAFGKEVRKHRVDRSMKLLQMAEALKVSAAWLSAVELGQKNIPEYLPDRIAAFLGLNDEETRNLQRLADMDRTDFTVKVPVDAGENSRDVAAVLARRFDELSEVDLERIRKMFETKDGK